MGKKAKSNSGAVKNRTAGGGPGGRRVRRSRGEHRDDWLLGGDVAMGEPSTNRAEGAFEVYAGGGIVWRRDDSGAIEVLVVHRPRYDDWSFPKGKRDPGESDEDCALREVAEETGFACERDIELARSTYRDRRGRSKQVRYWTMTIVGAADHDPGEEVDVVRWLPLAEVPGVLSYERERPVFDSFCALVACERL